MIWNSSIIFQPRRVGGQTMPTTLRLDFQKMPFEILLRQLFDKLFFQEKYVHPYLFIKNKMLVRVFICRVKVGLNLKGYRN